MGTKGVFPLFHLENKNTYKTKAKYKIKIIIKDFVVCDELALIFRWDTIS